MIEALEGNVNLEKLKIKDPYPEFTSDLKINGNSWEVGVQVDAPDYGVQYYITLKFEDDCYHLYLLEGEFYLPMNRCDLPSLITCFKAVLEDQEEKEKIQKLNHP